MGPGHRGAVGGGRGRLARLVCGDFGLSDRVVIRVSVLGGGLFFAGVFALGVLACGVTHAAVVSLDGQRIETGHGTYPMGLVVDGTTGWIALEGTGEILRLDLAAAYSLVHFVMFTTVGAAFAVLAQRLRGLASPVGVLVGGLFVTLTAGFFTLDAIVGPNLAAAIGLTPIVLGNLLAAGGMTAFYAQAFELEGARAKVPTTLIGDSE